PVPAHSGVFNYLTTSECHFTNGTEKVRFMDRYFYNRVEYMRFDSDVGEYVGFTTPGERAARNWNKLPEYMERARTAVDWFCRHNYGINAPFSADR
ncbi:2B1E protein, partial [Malurus elegans]|nr:2B1E protein [Malurus elegans]